MGHQMYSTHFFRTVTRNKNIFVVQETLSGLVCANSRLRLVLIVAHRTLRASQNGFSIRHLYVALRSMLVHKQ